MSTKQTKKSDIKKNEEPNKDTTPAYVVSIHNRKVVDNVVLTLHQYGQVFQVAAVKQLQTPEEDRQGELLGVYNGHPFTNESPKTRAQHFGAWRGKYIESASWYTIAVVRPSKRTANYLNLLNAAMNIMPEEFGEQE